MCSSSFPRSRRCEESGLPLFPSLFISACAAKLQINSIVSFPPSMLPLWFLRV